MMGAHVLELARLHGVAKLVVAGTVCAYPKFTPTPFREDDLWNGYPEETNAPYGVAKKSVLVGAQAYREQYGLDAVYLLPANLYGPRDNFDLETSHVVPALIRKMLDGDRARSCSGATARRRASSSTSRTPPTRSCSRPSATTGAEPVNIGTGVEISIRELAEHDRRADRLRRARSSGTSRCRTASRAGGSTRAAAERAVRLRARHAAPRRARAHDRVVPRAGRRSRMRRLAAAPALGARDRVARAACAPGACSAGSTS